MEDILDTIVDTCPECGSTDVWRNSSDYLMCDNCGYEEVTDYEICELCGEEVPEGMLDDDGLCPVCSELDSESI